MEEFAGCGEMWGGGAEWTVLGVGVKSRGRVEKGANAARKGRFWGRGMLGGGG